MIMKKQLSGKDLQGFFLADRNYLITAVIIIIGIKMGTDLNYKDNLYKAREAAELRFREKGLDKKRVRITGSEADLAEDQSLGFSVGSPSASESFVSKRKSAKVDEGLGYLTEYFFGLTEENKSLSELLAVEFEKKSYGTDTVSKDTTTAKGYPLDKDSIFSIIEEESKLRNIESNTAMDIYRNEGYNSYQSNIGRRGHGSRGGKEASYGPFQLFTGGGLGNEYEEATGRVLAKDNTEDGIRKQIQFALDKAAEKGSWNPWYGRKAAGVSSGQGLKNAKPIYNWKEK